MLFVSIFFIFVRFYFYLSITALLWISLVLILFFIEKIFIVIKKIKLKMFFKYKLNYQFNKVSKFYAFHAILLRMN